MSIPLKPLPIVEHWDCHGCGICCRGAIVALGEEDLRKLREQHWEQDPEMRGVKYLVRMGGLFSKRYRLAHQKDGRCVFQRDDKLCRIHAQFGYEAKPSVCRLAPLQMVPLERFAYVTLRRYCPSAAADKGRTIEEQLNEYRDLVVQSHAEPRAAPPPALTRWSRRPWKDVFAVAEMLNRLVLDERYPLVRRLVHGLEFCDLVERASLGKFAGGRMQELLSLLAAAAVRDADVWFQNRAPPQRLGARFFRQTAMEYLRLHPEYVPETSWRERWRLIRAAAAFSRGTGRVPSFRLPFPEAAFPDLERPLGSLSEEALRPLVHYFESAVVSLRYAMFKKRLWPMVEAFRALVLGYPIALWMLRYACGPRPPEVDDVIRTVMMLDRGETRASLVGFRHRLRVRALARHRQLAPLTAWYAR